LIRALRGARRWSGRSGADGFARSNFWILFLGGAGAFSIIISLPQVQRGGLFLCVAGTRRLLPHPQKTLRRSWAAEGAAEAAAGRAGALHMATGTVFRLLGSRPQATVTVAPQERQGRGLPNARASRDMPAPQLQATVYCARPEEEFPAIWEKLYPMNEPYDRVGPDVPRKEEAPMRMIIPALSAFLLAAAVQDRKFGPTNPDPNGPNPIAAHPTLFIEEMTWMEVRDALKAGKDTAIVATGGVEQNGPYLSTGKHNVVLRATTQAIAERLGNALIAPIVPFVPEGDIDPPTSHMKYPGTISLSEETFRSLLTDICASLRAHGFKNLILIGDSGGNQAGMKKVAADLNAKWGDGKTRLHFIPEYYDYGDLGKWLKEQGIRETPEGFHDDFAMEAQMLFVDPTTIRMKERIAAGKFRINGVDLAPVEKTVEWGRRIVGYRADQTVAAIKKSMSR
jgi:creatinine amidohydrolase